MCWSWLVGVVDEAYWKTDCLKGLVFPSHGEETLDRWAVTEVGWEVEAASWNKEL